eukprot:CAMPEP_0184290910 /NCGR_PEP_ID=MMETSP1049-20130417/3043_1 /TAXON_ID=77928 /ORGANISM="Proteomonas sulcata, Strain CCMP704" /LENGTH=677 /DNA_ID=CAMNT_0026598191 /DNA_START=116 /DNA_END=2149 /DNA_ORIENTATION=-
MNPMNKFDLSSPEGQPLVVVSPTFPHRIMHASREWLDLFRFSREEVASRSLKIVQGPATNAVVLNELLQAAHGGKTNEAPITVYSSGGQGAIMCVKATPKYTGPEVTACVLTMQPSTAIPVKTAAAEDGRAKVLVTVQEPHNVEHVSPLFTNIYGMAELQILGRTLRMIQGPRTDQMEWKRLMKEATKGLSHEGVVHTSTIDCTELLCNMSVQPAYSPNGQITHLMAVFSAHHNTHVPGLDIPRPAPHAPSMVPPSNFEMPTSRPAPSMGTAPCHVSDGMQVEEPVPSVAVKRETTPQYSAEQQPNNLVDAFPRSSHHVSDAFQQHPPAVPGAGGTYLPIDYNLGQQRPAEIRPFTFADTGSHSADFGGSDFSFTVSTAQQHQFHQAAMPQQGQKEPERQEGDKAASTIFPRRKQGQQRKDSTGPVVVTLELLEQYSDISLTDAAKKLGISPTAVKKACRKLGVQRWPYKKNPDPVEPQVINTYDESYVRKLYRKYAAKPVRKPSAQAQARAAAKEADISCNISDGGSTGPSTPADSSHDELAVSIPQHINSNINSIYESQSYGQRGNQMVFDGFGVEGRAGDGPMFDSFDIKPQGAQTLGSVKARAPGIDFAQGTERLQPLHVISEVQGDLEVDQGRHPHHTTLESLDTQSMYQTSLEPLRPETYFEHGLWGQRTF